MSSCSNCGHDTTATDTSGWRDYDRQLAKLAKIGETERERYGTGLVKVAEQQVETGRFPRRHVKVEVLIEVDACGRTDHERRWYRYPDSRLERGYDPEQLEADRRQKLAAQTGETFTLPTAMEARGLSGHFPSAGRSSVEAISTDPDDHGASAVFVHLPSLRPRKQPRMVEITDGYTTMQVREDEVALYTGAAT